MALPPHRVDRPIIDRPTITLAQSGAGGVLGGLERGGGPPHVRDAFQGKSHTRQLQLSKSASKL